MFFRLWLSILFILNSPVILRPSLSVSLGNVKVCRRIPVPKELKSKVYEEQQKEFYPFNYRKNKLRKI